MIESQNGKLLNFLRHYHPPDFFWNLGRVHDNS